MKLTRSQVEEFLLEAIELFSRRVAEVNLTPEKKEEINEVTEPEKEEQKEMEGEEEEKIQKNSIRKRKEELDSQGYPYDPRIHSEERTKTTKGIWRKRKGITPAEIKAVQKEFKNEEDDIPLPPSPINKISEDIPVPPPPPNRLWTFEDFMPAISTQGITQERLQEVLNAHGVANNIDLSGREVSVISQIAQELGLNDA